jgi:tRNA(Ile)-lysidine synthase
LEYDHIEAILGLATQEEGDGRLQAPGLDVFRSFGQVRVARPVTGGLEGRNWRIPLQLPGKTALPDGKWLLSLQFVEPKGYNEGEGDLDRSRLAAPLEVRNWRPGDQYQRCGRSHPDKLKTLFQQARVPLWERRNWPVVTMEDRIVWAMRFGPASEFAAREDSREILRFSIISGPSESDSMLQAS